MQSFPCGAGIACSPGLDQARPVYVVALYDLDKRGAGPKELFKEHFVPRSGAGPAYDCSWRNVLCRSFLFMAAKLFSELGLSSDLLKAIDRLGFEQAAPIQAEAIPLLLQGKDVVGQSQTGSG